MLDVALLGTGGMMPLTNRALTALLLRHNGRLLLIDCGEGTQVTLRELGWGFVHLDAMLFTHFHADHIAGLPGMLLSLSNYGRTEPLTIVGPAGVAAVVDHLRVIAPELAFPIQFVELAFEEQSPRRLQLGGLQLSALPLEHALPCIGYGVQIPRAGKFDARRAKARDIPVRYWSRLQNGETVGGFTPDMVLGEPRRGIKVCYMTDTRPIDTIPTFIEGADLFICEGMYGDDTCKEKADRFTHMTFLDAARLAKAGNVRELWLTHFSPMLTDPQSYIAGAREVFGNAVAGTDRMTKSILFEE